MIAALVTIAILALAFALLLTLEMRRVSTIYETSYQMLVAERDAAREEAKTLKLALFPQLARARQPAQSAPRPPASPQDKVNSIFQNRRVPWRVRSKLLSQLTNTQQISRDRMAAAITPQPAAKDNSHA